MLFYLEKQFSWWLVPLLGGYIGALTMGYGGDELPEKLLRRFAFGGIFAVLGILIAVVQGVVVLGVFQAVNAIAVSMVLGIKNPLPAVYEEAVIALNCVAFVPFMVAVA